MTPDQLTEELQRVVKAPWATAPDAQRLMLFVKNLVFLDGAMPALPPISISSRKSLTSRRTSPRPTVLACRRGRYGSGGVRLRPRRHEGCVRCRWQRREDDVSRASGASRDHSQTSPGARLSHRFPQEQCRAPTVVRAYGRLCASRGGSVHRRLRRSTQAHLPSAVRLVMVKADGCVAVHADGGAYKPSTG